LYDKEIFKQNNCGKIFYYGFKNPTGVANNFALIILRSIAFIRWSFFHPLE